MLKKYREQVLCITPGRGTFPVHLYNGLSRKNDPQPSHAGGSSLSSSVPYLVKKSI